MVSKKNKTFLAHPAEAQQTGHKLKLKGISKQRDKNHVIDQCDIW
jgi:hypothetical protein